MKKFLKYLTIMILLIMSGLVWCGITKSIQINDIIPEIYIKAINPGYTIDGKSNVGEMIEISRKNSDTPISLAGATVGYTNSSGNNSILFEFPENSWMTSEIILLRLASSPEGELASVNYKKTIAMFGAIQLKFNDEVVDQVCWTGKDDCYKEFKSAHPTTLVRNLETGLFEHLEEYEPYYDENSYYVEQAKEEEGYGRMPSQCKGIQFSEILSFYETLKTEQFIEIYNANSEQVLLDGCQIRYKNKNHNLKGIIKPEEYFVYYPEGFNLTKNPTNSNMLELVDINGELLDRLVYSNGQKKGTSYALISYDKNGEEIWKTTYALTPGMPNIFQEFKKCEEGKVINEATGNCVKTTEVKTKTCKAGYYLNTITGRCKKIKTSTEKQCKEGYYLNPETGRCKKIKENSGADYSVKPEEYEESSSFVALYAILGVVGLLGGYLIYEFRKEIVKLFGKVFRRFH